MHRQRVVLVLQLSHVLLRRLELLVLERDTTLQNLVFPHQPLDLALCGLLSSVQLGALCSGAAQLPRPLRQLVSLLRQQSAQLRYLAILLP